MIDISHTNSSHTNGSHTNSPLVGDPHRSFTARSRKAHPAGSRRGRDPERQITFRVILGLDDQNVAPVSVLAAPIDESAPPWCACPSPPSQPTVAEEPLTAAR